MIQWDGLLSYPWSLVTDVFARWLAKPSFTRKQYPDSLKSRAALDLLSPNLGQASSVYLVLDTRDIHSSIGSFMAYLACAMTSHPGARVPGLPTPTIAVIGKDLQKDDTKSHLGFWLKEGCTS